MTNMKLFRKYLRKLSRSIGIPSDLVYQKCLIISIKIQFFLETDNYINLSEY